MRTVYRNVALLAMSQAMFTSASSSMAAVLGLTGWYLAPDRALATLPVTTMVLGTALATIPASLLMRRVGRRTGFCIGASLGVTGSLLAAGSVYLQEFWLLVPSMMVFGFHMAFGQLYRFAASDTAPEGFRARAISLTLAGGLLAAFIGPQIAKWSKNWVPDVNFLGTFLAMAALCAAIIPLVAFIDIPRPSSAELRGPQRPLREVASQPVFLVAALSAMVGYGVMNLLMTGTPLAMVAHGLQFNDAATVIQWHVLAMFLPSFFTGALIQRYGVLTMIMVGAVLDLLAVAFGLGGFDWLNFWVALVLVGLGWNFMFIGGSTLLTSAYSTSERPKSQALNEFLVFGTMAVASLSSGQLLHYLGWQMVVWAAVPPVLLAASGVVWLAWRSGTLQPVGSTG